MELQPKHLSDEEKALSKRCIDSYKTFRDLIFTGDLYRIASPYDGDYYALMYVSEDKRRAVLFNYCMSFQNHSIGTYSGAFLSNGGFNPRMREANTSAVFILECEQAL